MIRVLATELLRNMKYLPEAQSVHLPDGSISQNQLLGRAYSS